MMYALLLNIKWYFTCSNGFWSFLIMILALMSPRNLMRASTWHSLMCLRGLFLALTSSPI